MAYTRAFFDFQLSFAQRLADRFQLDLADTLYHYTTFTKSFGREKWADYVAGLEQAADPTAWTYQWYFARRDVDPTPNAVSFYDHPLFGCFYYVVRENTIIRPHFIKNELPGRRPLSQSRLEVRQAELRQMFVHIRDHVPTAETVLGNSWLYNVAAYRRLYPPAYTATLPTSTEDEFQFLALWGQCFDADWQPKAEVTQTLLDRVDWLENLANLRLCFPYQIRQPRCAITAFYAFYDIPTST